MGLLEYIEERTGDFSRIEKQAYANGLVKANRLVDVLVCEYSMTLLSARAFLLRYIKNNKDSKTGKLRKQGIASGWYALEDLTDLVEEVME